MSKQNVSEEALNEVQEWAVRRFSLEECHRILVLIKEIRRLRKLVDRSASPTDTVTRPRTSNRDSAKQCQFIREIGGHRFQCAAAAKYGEFCGHHKQRHLKQRPKGCTAIGRTGRRCLAVVMRDELCPSHWLKTFGHVYVRDGEGFRCDLCEQRFDYWAVEGRGRDRKGSIKRLAKCPLKLKHEPGTGEA